MEELDYIDFAPYDLPTADRRKLDVGDIYINQVRRTTCGWYIRIKNRHDYRTCKCGKLSIDGGSWYMKLRGDIENVEYQIVPYKLVNESNQRGCAAKEPAMEINPNFAEFDEPTARPACVSSSRTSSQPSPL